MKYVAPYSFLILCSVLSVSCGSQSSDENSQLQITQVAQSPVKRQAIDNCWLYASGAWLESLVKNSDDTIVNVSESYWTYWDMFDRAKNGKLVTKDGISSVTGGWSQAAKVIGKYGWIEEAAFIPGDESSDGLSKAQRCMTIYVEKSFKDKTGLFSVAQPSDSLIHEELKKAFSCDGRFVLDAEKSFVDRHSAEATMLKKGEDSVSLASLFKNSIEVQNPASDALRSMPVEDLDAPTRDKMKAYEKRIKRALNDHQPLILGFYMSFDVIDNEGRIYLEDLSAIDNATDFGGHMVLLNDYTVRASDGEEILAEGELDDAAKAQALESDLDFLIAKNSWGVGRPGKDWLGDGYTRISWAYLSTRYQSNSGPKAVLKSIIFPPGY